MVHIQDMLAVAAVTCRPAQAIEALRSFHSPRAPLCSIVCGPKNVGKSSFARHLCNDLLQEDHTAEVAFLEGDCGQPGIGPPGSVTLTYLRQPLLLPASMTQKNADLSAFIGDTTPESHPLLFVRALSKLIAVHRAKWQAGALALLDGRVFDC
jgi:polynucleotide 5'-hydroxyl-kinase GRC3/NOL9